MSDLAISRNYPMVSSGEALATNEWWDDWWNAGWPGEPYDNWNPTTATVAPHSGKDVRGWCYVWNDTEIPIKIRSTGNERPRDYIGNQLLVIDATAPDGNWLHLVTDFPLSRGGTNFSVTLVKSYDEYEKKEVYSLKADWHNGYRDRYEEKKQERKKHQYPPGMPKDAKISLKRLSLQAQRA